MDCIESYCKTSIAEIERDLSQWMSWTSEGVVPCCVRKGRCWICSIFFWKAKGPLIHFNIGMKPYNTGCGTLGLIAA